MALSSKRKSTSLGLERRVRARHEDDWEPEPEVKSEASSRSGSDEDDDEKDSDEDADGDSGSEESQASGSRDDNAGLTSISFGALARAQASLPPPERKRGAAQASSEEPPIKPKTRKAEEKNRDKDQGPRRTSKHAPQEVTSKKPVSRRREIMADTRRAKARDPRFDPVSGGPADEARTAKAYAFLDEYRESEMAELRAQMKKTKDAAGKEALKRQLMSMESRKKARREREESARVLEEHRRKEKELVAQGKKPFYLKQREQRKQLLVKRYEGMSKGQVERAMERKRKKVASKEKKELVSLERMSRRG